MTFPMRDAPRTNKVRLTQAELGKACGFSRQSIVSEEGGDYAPSVYLGLKLAKALGTTVEILFAGEE